MRTVLATLAVLATGSAQAVLIDFESLPIGELDSNQITIEGAIFTSPNGLFNIFDDVTNSLCPFDPASFNCEQDMNVTFADAVNNLSFNTLGHNDGDEFTVDVFGDGGLLGSVIGSSNTFVDLSAFANVTEINIRYTGAFGAGYSYDNFEFQPVPIPGAVWLFGSSIGLLGWFRRRKAL